MEWYKNKDELTSNERVILSILTLNEDPEKIWIRYSDVSEMSPMMDDEFQETLQSLMENGIIKLGNQGQGISLALNEKIEAMKIDKLNETISEIQKEIKVALDNEDYELATELEKIISNRKK